MKFKDLEQEQQNKLVLRAKTRSDGTFDNEARTELWRGIVGLLIVKVKHMAKNSEADVYDFVQEGYLYFVDMIDEFEPDKKIPFAIYSTNNILWSLRKSFGGNWNFMKLTRYDLIKNRSIFNALELIGEEHVTNENIDEVANITGLKKKIISNTIIKQRNGYVSFTSEPDELEEREDTQSIGYRYEELIDTLKETLTENEYNVLGDYLGLEGKEQIKLQKILKKYEISNTTFYRMKNDIITKVKKEINI